MPKGTEQQKLYLTPMARAKLRDKAAAKGWELSEIVEFLIVRGAYPAAGDKSARSTPPDRG